VIEALQEHCSQENTERVQEKEQLIGILRNKLADKVFLLAVLAFVDDLHPILQRNYRPPSQPTRMAQAIMVQDPEGILKAFQDLPAS
jgi:hypothetical protein